MNRSGSDFQILQMCSQCARPFRVLDVDPNFYPAWWYLAMAEERR